MQIAGREVQITNPDKVFFPVAGYTKGDLLDYYLAVAEGAVRAVANRPMALKRFVHGAEGEAFFQKRAPANRPPWIDTAVLSFPSGRTAEETVVHDAAQLAWVVNLGCIDLNPHPVRSDDLDHPDELRIDLVLASDAVAARVRAAWVDRQARKGSGPSDHAPVIVDLDEAPDGDIGPVVPPPSAPAVPRGVVKLPQAP